VTVAIKWSSVVTLMYSKACDIDVLETRAVTNHLIWRLFSTITRCHINCSLSMNDQFHGELLFPDCVYYNVCVFTFRIHCR